MKFKNELKDAKKVLVDKKYHIWKTVYPGDEIELDSTTAKNVGLTPVEGKASGKKVETKVYKKKLKDIDGVGEKTTEDIINIYPSLESLREAVKSGKEIPVRNDIAEKLKVI